MEDMLALLRAQGAPAADGRQAILACNEVSARYGLTLTGQEAEELLEGRSAALRAAGRVELGGGILPRLIRVFCSSPYLDRDNYAAALGELQEVFYYYKSECFDRFTDVELLELMAAVFNGRAQGSVDFLAGTSLEALCRYARSGDDWMEGEEDVF